MKKIVARWLCLPLALFYAVAPAFGEDCECYHCQKFHCPPKFRHCMEGKPRIKFECGCPRPICNPCNHPNWGYYETCWTPWPWPRDYSHCPVNPPAAVVPPVPGPRYSDLVNQQQQGDVGVPGVRRRD